MRHTHCMEDNIKHKHWVVFMAGVQSTSYFPSFYSKKSNMN